MRTHRILALAASSLLSLSLFGCFGQTGVEDAVNAVDDLAQHATATAQDIAERAQEASDALADIDWSKESRVAVRNASTGEVIAELSDQAAIGAAFSGLSEAGNLAATPDAPEEYVFEVWQNATIELGESSASTEQVQVLSVVTFEGSDIVRLTVSPIGLSLNFSSPQTASSLRQLVA